MSIDSNINYSISQLYTIAQNQGEKWTIITDQNRPHALECIFKALSQENSCFSSYDLLLAAKIVKILNLKDQDSLLKTIATRIDSIAIEKKSFSPQECRSSLIQQGILPTHEEAKRVYWSLGDDWWRQIIDGKHQRHGKWVFDKGLHGGHIEPGYIDGVEKASRYFIECTEGLTFETYKQTHHIACEHFKQEVDDGTICSRLTIDLFRTNTEKCTSPLLNAEAWGINKKLKDIQNIIFTLNFYLDSKNPEVIEEQSYFNISYSAKELQELEERFIHARDWLATHIDPSFKEMEAEDISQAINNKKIEILKRLNSIAGEVSAALNLEFASIAQRLSLDKPFVECSTTPDQTLRIEYQPYSTTRNFEKITDQLITEFNANLFELQKATACKVQDAHQDLPRLIEIQKEYQDAVVPLTARLYAELEWAHPWIDGQGRTDLIMLNGTLCNEGLHPSVLGEPYFSTCNPVDKWTAYLKHGMTRFETLNGQT